jgi:hypothetical protein
VTDSLLDALWIAWALVAFGAHAVVPWTLAGDSADPELERRRLVWSRAALPLLLSGALAVLLALRAQPDAALAHGLVPFHGSRLGRVALVLLPALAAAVLVTSFGWRRLENLGWRLAALFGAAALVPVAWIFELLRIGEGPAGDPGTLAGTVACRALVGLAAGHVAAPGRPWLAFLGGAALPVYAWLLPPVLSAALGPGGDFLTLYAGTLILLAAPLLPARLRRPAVAVGVVLASLFFARAGDLSQALGQPLLDPLLDLPAPPV